MITPQWNSNMFVKRKTAEKTRNRITDKRTASLDLPRNTVSLLELDLTQLKNYLNGKQNNT